MVACSCSDQCFNSRSAVMIRNSTVFISQLDTKHLKGVVSTALCVCSEKLKVGESFRCSLTPIMGANINLRDHLKPTGSTKDSKFMRTV